MCLDLWALFYPAFAFAVLAGFGVAMWGLSHVMRAERKQ